MICQQCGYENTHEATFCRECGSALNASAEPKTPPPPPMPVEQKDPGELYGLLSVIFGIAGVGCSLGACLTGVSSAIGIVSTIAGIVFAVMGDKKSKEAGFQNGKAKLGMLFSCIGVALNLLFFTLVLVVLTGFVFMMLAQMGFIGYLTM